MISLPWTSNQLGIVRSAHRVNDLSGSFDPMAVESYPEMFRECPDKKDMVLAFCRAGTWTIHFRTDPECKPVSEWSREELLDYAHDTRGLGGFDDEFVEEPDRMHAALTIADGTTSQTIELSDGEFLEMLSR